MTRRDNTSRAGTGCAGYLLLNVVGLVGCLLALPVLLPDLMAEQSPPLDVAGAGRWAVVYGVPVAAACVLTAVAGGAGRFLWWLFLLRAAVLLVAAAGAVLYAETRVAGQPWHVRAPVEALSAGLAALAVHLVVRRWDRRRGARPLAGEVWLAMVPLREDPERQLRHYCVVLQTGSGAAQVAQITSKDKDGRRDHIRIPNTGWDEVSGRPHWVEIGRQPRVVPYRRFLKSRPQGRCPDAVWAQLRARRPTPAAAPAGAGAAGPQRAAARLLRLVLGRNRG
ncbi:type II toxin-antitoxin system PemK/MazF family toxin [Streptomyces sp. NPDC047718]|uniref:type II toxin-antitoxin system PemK/MazF family toxin n=1 Tax=Streptomyces sp. NPDC047718 TaxID=3155479 RepID=UPI0033FA0452